MERPHFQPRRTDRNQPQDKFQRLQLYSQLRRDFGTRQNWLVERIPLKFIETCTPSGATFDRITKFNPPLSRVYCSDGVTKVQRSKAFLKRPMYNTRPGRKITARTPSTSTAPKLDITARGMYTPIKEDIHVCWIYICQCMNYVSQPVTILTCVCSVLPGDRLLSCLCSR